MVRNGEDYLAETIESLLNQTHSDFELVVYDNASTDRTPHISDYYARLDKRVRIVRHAQDIGIVANFITALENASTPYFCWAACDDLREPTFLETLLDLLERNPEAALASCAVRNLNPNGEMGEVRTDADDISSCTNARPGRRLAAYLKRTPCTLFYGLYRTEAAKGQLALLKQMAEPPDVIPLAGDMVFLAELLKRRSIVMTPEPLLLFRRGGASHRVDLHNSLRQSLTQVWLFTERIRGAVSHADDTLAWRMRVRFALWRFLARFLLGPPLWRMFLHHLMRTAPGVARMHAAWSLRTNPAFKRLKNRAEALPPGSRVVILGAGKHTRRCFGVIASALGHHAVIAGICDDAADRREPVGGFAITPADEIANLSPDLLLISSDTYESALARRALQIAPPGIPVWCIYDRSLEGAVSADIPGPAAAADRSSASTESMKVAI